MSVPRHPGGSDVFTPTLYILARPLPGRHEAGKFHLRPSHFPLANTFPSQHSEPVWTSHTRTASSADPHATRLRSIDKETDRTLSLSDADISEQRKKRD